jgi:hypothetical protein
VLLSCNVCTNNNNNNNNNNNTETAGKFENSNHGKPCVVGGNKDKEGRRRGQQEEKECHSSGESKALSIALPGSSLVAITLGVARTANAEAQSGGD